SPLLSLAHPPPPLSPPLSRTPAAGAAGGVDPTSIPIFRSTPPAPPHAASTHAARTLSPRLIDLRQHRRAPPPISAARTTSLRLTDLLRRYSASINLQINKAVEAEEAAIHNRQRQRDAAAASRSTAAYPYSRHRSSSAERFRAPFATPTPSLICLLSPDKYP
ncbi:Os06g0154800, partial [Oryza sativa Japonica Group]